MQLRQLQFRSPLMLRYFLIFAFAILASCTDPITHAKNRLKGVDKQALRMDAAKLYKQIYATPGADFLILKQTLWPENFNALKPIRVSCYRDGFAIALTDDSILETGLHVQPLGITRPPTPGSIKYERIEEGIYWYSVKK